MSCLEKNDGNIYPAIFVWHDFVMVVNDRNLHKTAIFVQQLLIALRGGT